MVVEDVFVAMPVLATDRLMLRAMTEADADGLFDIFSDDEVCEYYAWDTFTDLDQARELAARGVEQYRRKESLRWGLTLPGTDRIIGTCGYARWSREHRYGVLGYDLARRYWRQGLMSEAVAEVLRFGFEQLDLHRVEATMLVGNAASAAVLTRAGFRLEGQLAERAWHRGAFHDMQFFGLTKPTWLAANHPPTAAAPG
jgi:ribosomal-protein-alanine N-acetyltransferase